MIITAPSIDQDLFFTSMAQNQPKSDYSTMNPYNSPLFAAEDEYNNNTNTASSSNNYHSQSPFVQCVSPHLLSYDQSLSFDQQDNDYSAHQLDLTFNSPPPDLCNDVDDDDMMQDDSGTVEPFKPYSPYSNNQLAFRNHSVLYNSMLSLTMAPQDAMLNTHEDDDSLVFQGLDSSKFHVPDYNMVRERETFDLPEAQDDEDDDEDCDEYDEMLISSSDDEMDDLYEPERLTPRVPGLTAFGTEPPASPAAAAATSPETHTPDSSEDQNNASSSYESPDSPDSSPSPPPNPTHRRLPSIDTDSRPKKRLPIGAHAGPHRCDAVNPDTGKPCNKEFSRPYDLIRHQGTIHAAVRKTFRCEACGEASRTFSRMDALSRHIRVKHSRP